MSIVLGVELPSDYEVCECGFDHSYEQQEAVAAHILLDQKKERSLQRARRSRKHDQFLND
jgi:hypothetical protein